MPDLLNRSIQTDMFNPAPVEPAPEPAPKVEPEPQPDQVKTEKPKRYKTITLPFLEALAYAKENGLEISDNYDFSKYPPVALWRPRND